MNNKYEILTENGFKDFLGVITKESDATVTLTFESGNQITSSLTHRYKVMQPDSGLESFVEAIEISEGAKIAPSNEVVKSKDVSYEKVTLYDVVEVADGNHYITNGVTSHNCEFISSDHTLFDSYLVSEAERDYDRKVAEITAGDLNKEEEDYVPSYPFKYANTVMWKNIERGKTYIVGVDPATGSGLDYTVFQVFEFPSLFQVMEYRSNTMSSPVAYVQLKNLLKFIERHTQEVYFSIENNGVGNGMISLYEADEDNPPKAHMVSDKKGNQNGMNTTAFTKMTSALKFKELFERRQMVLNSKILMHEMKNYVRKDGSYAANTNVNDDCISAILMVLRIIEEMASYDDTAYSRIYNVDAQIEMEGRWDYNENDFINSVSRRNEVEEEWDENDMPMPMLI